MTNITLSPIEAAALRWSDLMAATDSPSASGDDNLRDRAGPLIDAAENFVLVNEATTATEAALQAAFLHTVLDIMDNSMPPDPAHHEATIARLATAAESVAKFLAGMAGDRFNTLTAGKWGLDSQWYRFPEPLRRSA